MTYVLREENNQTQTNDFRFLPKSNINENGMLVVWKMKRKNKKTYAKHQKKTQTKY